MRGYLVKWILATIPVMSVVAVFVFSLLRLTPGDPAAIIAGDYANPKDVAQIRQKLNQATDDWHTARVTLSGAQGLVCRREASLGSA